MGANCIIVVEVKNSSVCHKNIAWRTVFGNVCFMVTFSELTTTEVCINERYPYLNVVIQHCTAISALMWISQQHTSLASSCRENAKQLPELMHMCIYKICTIHFWFSREDLSWTMTSASQSCSDCAVSLRLFLLFISNVIFRPKHVFDMVH